MTISENGERLFTEQDVENLKKGSRKGLQRRIEALEQEIVRAKESPEFKLREELHQRLAEKERQHRELDERHAAEFATLKSEWDVKLGMAQSELDEARDKFHTQQRKFAIIDAARAAGAFNADQVLALVSHHCRTLPNGEVVIQGLVPEALQSPAEAVASLRDEMPNLFRDLVCKKENR